MPLSASKTILLSDRADSRTSSGVAMTVRLPGRESCPRTHSRECNLGQQTHTSVSGATVRSWGRHRGRVTAFASTSTLDGYLGRCS
jgi:hypothetical protein